MSFSGAFGGTYALTDNLSETIGTSMEKSGFAKKCEHGHWMHTPNDAPLPAHNIAYHYDIAGFEDLYSPQSHENDLTGRGYSLFDIHEFLRSNRGYVKMCGHGALIGRGQHGEEAFSEDCTQGHDRLSMAGVERNAPLMQRKGPAEPRSEKEIVDQEPERAQNIRENIAKVVKVAESPRVQNSGYTTKLYEAGTMPNPLYGKYWNPRGSSNDAEWGMHRILSYHNGKAIGHLSYNDTGKVTGFYIDPEHHNSPAALQMLATAHKHLLQLDNPLGMLKSDNTTGYSAPLIRKVDPDSTYLRSPGSGLGHSRDPWVRYDNSEMENLGLPTDLNNNEKRSHKEWEDLSDITGRNIHSLLAASPDAVNRGMADLREADPTSLLINRSLGRDAGSDTRKNRNLDPEPFGPVIPNEEALQRARALLKTRKQA